MEVDDEYRVTKVSALICGDKDANTDEFNACNKDNISQPDNIAYVPGHDGLIIGTRSLALLSMLSFRDTSYILANAA